MVRFWDTSALLQLIVKQPHSAKVADLYVQSPNVVCWWGTRLEIISGLSRLNREQLLTEQELICAKERVEKLMASAQIVEPRDQVLNRAERILTIHALKAADALQLAAALCAIADQTNGSEFVSFDKNLRQAAQREGFKLWPNSIIH